MRADERAVQEFFDGSPRGLELYRTVAEVVSALGDVEVRVTKSQIAFRHHKGFAYVWRPGRYVTSDVPMVLSIALPTPLRSTRFKEVAHPAPRVWMHHLELLDATDVDDELRGWLADAFAAAG